MDTSDLRRELGTSVRLLAGPERWLLLGLLAGGVGYLVWVAGTAVAVSRAAEALAGPVSVDPWSSGAAGLAVAFALLWVVAPAALAVYFVVGNLTNLRGNIDQPYRVDRPLVLLVPPLVALAAVVGVAVARESASPAVLAAVGAASALLLVRTVAYGYRVYSLSVPRLLQALVFVAAAVAGLAVVSRADSLTGQEALVAAVADRYGVAEYAFGETTVAGLSAPTLPLAAAVAPAALAFAYLAVQLLASVVVRVRRPDVPRSSIRAGQRYPAVVQPGTSRRLAMGTGSPVAGGGGAAAAGSDGENGDATADAAANDDGTDGDGAAASGAEESDDGPGGADASADDRMGQTRVFTPPDDADPMPADGPGEESADAAADATDVVEGGNAVKSELCPICGATYEADADRTQCPNCDAVLDTE